MIDKLNAVYKVAVPAYELQVAMTPIVLQHKGWRHLLRALSSKSDFRWFSRFTQADLQKGLVIPVAVARWICQFQPTLSQQDSLHLVIAGAEQGADSAAGGRWFQLLPALLGNPTLKVRVSLVGPFVNGTSSAEVPLQNLEADRAWPGMPAWPVAPRHAMTIGQFAEKTDLSQVDLVILSHPGLEFNPEQWLAQNQLARVLAAHVPVGVLSFALDEFEAERWAAAAFNYQIGSHVEENPFALHPDVPVGLPLAIAHSLWTIEQGPAPGSQPNQSMLDTLQRYVQTADAWISAGEGAFIPEAGTLLEEDEPMVMIPPLLAASLETGMLLFSDEHGNYVEAPFQLPEELKNRRPSLQDLPFARMAWALEVSEAIMNMADADTPESLD